MRLHTHTYCQENRFVLLYPYYPMTTQQMIEEIQEKIADKTLSMGCVFEVWWEIHVYTTGSTYTITQDMLDKYPDISNKLWDVVDICVANLQNYYRNKWLPTELKIIWHPVSLSRVLSALGDKIVDDWWWWRALAFWDEAIYDTSHSWLNWDDKVCDRKLLKEDWSDAYLQDQSDETIQALHGLLVR